MYAQHNGHLAALWGMTVSADQKKRPDSPSPSCKANPANGVMSALITSSAKKWQRYCLFIAAENNTAHLHVLIENSLAQIILGHNGRHPRYVCRGPIACIHMR